MSVAASATVQRQQSLHLYRALLRQCTYLPDVVARREIRKQVVHSFRAHQVPRHGQKNEAIPTLEQHDRIMKRLFKGRQSLRTLEKANEGSKGSLALVLRHAYGRTGKRRYDLLRSLLVPPVWSQQVQATTDAKSSNSHCAASPWDISTVAIPDIFVPVKNDSRGVIEYHIAPKYARLKAILASQSKIQSSMCSRAKIKEHVPSIPLFNSWLRSMPRKRVKNMARKHYAHLISRVMPPLPMDEFERLSRICSGTQACEPVPKRRAHKGLPDVEHLRQQDLDALANVIAKEAVTSASGETATGPTLNLPASQPTTANRALLFDTSSVATAWQNVLEAEVGLRRRHAVRRNRRNDPHVLSPRYIRRQLHSVFSYCPRLIHNSQQGRWDVVFGIGKSDKVKPDASPVDRLFQKLISRST